MTRKKLILIIAALCLAAGIGLAMALLLGGDDPPQSGSARFVHAPHSPAREAWV